MAYALDALYVGIFGRGLNALQVAFGESFVSLLILLTVAILLAARCGDRRLVLAN